MWAVHAGVDWDWELPAVGLGLFALAGLALARPVSSSGMPARVVTSLPFRIAVAFACLLVALTGARTVIADAAIDNAKAALSAGQCGEASRDARLARSAVSTHPAAYEVLAYCDLEAGRSAAAIDGMRRATELDPNHWRYWYGLGVASGTAGQDPRPAMRRAWVLNPLGALVRANSPGERLREAPRRQWKRLAVRAPRPSN
jgi:Flp pilus assembly protein TadD